MKKKLVIIPEHTTLSNNIKDEYQKYFQNWDIHVFSWNNFKNMQIELTFENVYDEIKKWIDKENIDISKSHLIIKGCSGLILVDFLIELKPISCILVSVPLYKTIINPFLAFDSSYKTTNKHYWIQLKKEYYNYSNIFIDQKNPLFLEQLNLYKKSHEFFDVFNGKLNDYIYLRKYKNINQYDKLIYLLGKQDKLINIKKQIKILNKNNIKYVIFNNCAHKIDIDDSAQYFEAIKNIVSN